MNDFGFPAAVSEAFGLVNFYKEKSYYICETGDGTRYKVVRSHLGAGEILREHEVKEYLRRAGFAWVDNFLLTADGKPYISLGRDFFVAAAHDKAREVRFECGEDIKLAAKTLANMHNAAQSGEFDFAQLPYSTPLPEVFAKDSLELHGYAKQIRKKSGGLSEFEMLFIRHVDYYVEQINSAVESLERGNYATAARSICHNALKEETLHISQSGECCITDFSLASWDVALVDLAVIIRRHAARGGEDAVAAGVLVDSYSAVLPLGCDALNLLRGLLIYPAQFVKLAKQYFIKKRAFTPGNMISRLEQEIENKTRYEEYVKNM